PALQPPNRLGLREQAFRSLHMQVLDDAAVDDGDASAPGYGRFMSRKLRLRLGQRLRRGAEDLVRDGDLAGMDQCFAVKPHRAPVLAFGAQERVVPKGVANSVERDEPRRPRCEK